MESQVAQDWLGNALPKRGMEPGGMQAGDNRSFQR